jgi:hypothetical protein
MVMADSVSEHERLLRALRCVVSGSPYVTLHHTGHGSMREIAAELGLPSPGMSQKNNPFLQIPLAAEYHFGNMGIDVIGVPTWEERFGFQKAHLVDVSEQLGYDVFEAAQRWRKLHINRTFN